MMAIEAEYGNIFESQSERQLDQKRTNSMWFPFYEAFNRKEKILDIIENCQRSKQDMQQAKQLEQIKQQIARGGKVNLDALK